jgi:hypothetical protein
MYGYQEILDQFFLNDKRKTISEIMQSKVRCNQKNT